MKKSTNIKLQPIILNLNVKSVNEDKSLLSKLTKNSKNVILLPKLELKKNFHIQTSNIINQQPVLTEIVSSETDDTISAVSATITRTLNMNTNNNNNKQQEVDYLLNYNNQKF